jgi:hypothetical protein
MSATGRIQIAASLVGVMVTAWTTMAEAECVPLRTDGNLKYADVVFLGTVRHVAVDGMKQVVTLDVSRVWKGEVRRSIVFYQAPWASFDSFSFPAVWTGTGTQILVFAKRLTADQRRDFALLEHEAAFAVPPCGGTVALRDRRDAPRQLGHGRAPR